MARRRTYKVKHRGMLVRSLLLLLLVVALAVGAFFGVRALTSSKAKATPTPTAVVVQTPAILPTPTPQPTPRSITITAVGDVMVQSHQLNAAKKADGTYDFSGYFTEVKSYLDDGSIVLANLETTLPGSGYSGTTRYGAPDTILDAMRDAHFNLINTSNNHALDFNWEGVSRTVGKIKEYGFSQTGTYLSAAEYRAPLIVNKNGVKVAFIAYTLGVNSRESKVSAAQFSYCIRIIKNADYARDIKACRDAGADIIVALMHWGTENKRTPTDTTKNEATKALKAGYDIIIGSHPYVVCPVEIQEITRNDGTKKRVAVAYSLGNFVSDMRDRYNDCGIILNVTFKEDAANKMQIDTMSYVPVYVNRKSDYTDYRVLPVVEYMDDTGRLGTLDSTNKSKLERAYTDLTTFLGNSPAVLLRKPIH
jgi:poly-gamma-glutamate synthesis protein (capsule biosynthesis protein)